MLQRAFSFTILLAITLIVYGCGGDNPSGPEPGPGQGIISGTVTATDGRGGIEGVLLELSAEDTLTQETFSDTTGNFRFNKVEPGQYEVKITLPRGYKESGPTHKVIQVDGGVNIEFKGDPIKEQTATIQEGKQDTLFTGSGTFIAIDAGNTSSSVEVTIEEIEETELAEDVETKPVRVWIRPPGTAKKSKTQKAKTIKNSSNPIKASIGQRISDPNKYPNGANFTINGGAEEKPLRLYANADAKTYVDQATDEKVDYREYSFEPPSDANIEFSIGLSLPWEDNCSNDIRKLEPLQSDNSGEKALILIHGLQVQKGNCRDFENFNPADESFSSLINKLRSNSEIDENYKFYTYRYPTNASLIPSAEILWDLIQSEELNRPVLLAHSMGGLVGRVLMEKEGNDKVAGLITLGTPHEGSPIADLAVGSKATACASIPSICLANYLNGSSLLPITLGLRELRPNSSLIDSLKKAKGDSRKIFTLAGTLNDHRNVGTKNEIVYKTLYHLIEGKNDGMVSKSSAIPEWTGLQTVLDGHDHSEIKSGNDFGNSRSNSVSNQIIPTLSVLTECEPPPERVGSNDFNISGSVARTEGEEVQVTLNSISIDGEVVTDLSADNFMVIENGCVRPISNFSTDNVGVDIVFSQDMSGSMDNAISGVRSSVTEFANDLSNRGINVQIGSIGYSGPGEIPSTPGPSPCEFIGPIQDLTDPNSFRDHVSNQWVATGGCDAPENALESIEYAQQEISWREGASRVFINITDASHHTSSTNCNDLGPCTDQSISSLSEMVGGNSVIHAVADDSEYDRTRDGGADPWKLASRTGGENLVLPYGGDVDLTTIGITDVIGEASRFTFNSASPQEAIHTLRIRVEIDGKIAELAPDLVRYKRINSALSN